MRSSIKCLCCLLIATSIAASCGRREPAVREKSFLSLEEPVKIPDLLHGAIVGNGADDWLIAAFMDMRFMSATEPEEAIAVFESTGGGTWQRVAKITSPITYGVWGYDMAVDADGGLYMTWVCGMYKADSPSPFKAVMFSRSDDGGRTWSTPIVVNDLKQGQRSMPSMVVSGENIYIAWLDGRLALVQQSGQDLDRTLFFAASGDGGATWSANACLERNVGLKTAHSGAPSMVVGDDGGVYCAFFSMRRRDSGRGNEGGCWIAASDDGAKTFDSHLRISGAMGAISLAAQDEMLYVAAVHLAGHNIILHASTDGGEDWDERGAIDDDTGSSVKRELKLAALGKERLIACWDDTRGGVYVAASLDGGRTWGKNVRAARRSTVGNTPLDIAVDPVSGAFAIVAADVREGDGDALYVVRGRLTAEDEASQ